jgi:hypothetical protein
MTFLNSIMLLSESAGHASERYLSSLDWAATEVSTDGLLNAEISSSSNTMFKIHLVRANRSESPLVVAGRRLMADAS